MNDLEIAISQTMTAHDSDVHEVPNVLFVAHRTRNRWPAITLIATTVAIISVVTLGIAGRWSMSDKGHGPQAGSPMSSDPGVDGKRIVSLGSLRVKVPATWPTTFATLCGEPTEDAILVRTEASQPHPACAVRALHAITSVLLTTVAVCRSYGVDPTVAIEHKTVDGQAALFGSTTIDPRRAVAGHIGRQYVLVFPASQLVISVMTDNPELADELIGSVEFG